MENWLISGMLQAVYFPLHYRVNPVTLVFFLFPFFFSFSFFPLFSLFSFFFFLFSLSAAQKSMYLDGESTSPFSFCACGKVKRTIALELL